MLSKVLAEPFASFSWAFLYLWILNLGLEVKWTWSRTYNLGHKLNLRLSYKLWTVTENRGNFHTLSFKVRCLRSLLSPENRRKRRRKTALSFLKVIWQVNCLLMIFFLKYWFTECKNTLLFGAVREYLFQASVLASGGLLAIFGIPWLVEASLPSSSHGAVPVSLHNDDSLCMSFFVSKFTLYISYRIRAHSNNLIFNLVTAIKKKTKHLFSSSIAFWGTGG